MEIISLKDFALTGTFGSCGIGIKKRELVRQFGTPDSEQDLGAGSTVLLYGGYEFFFETDTEILHAIQNDHLQFGIFEDSGAINYNNDKIRIDTWFLEEDRDFTYKEVISILNEQGIKFLEKYYWGVSILLLESGVYFDFDNRVGIWSIDTEENVEEEELMKIKDRKNYVLNAMRYFSKLKIE